MENYFRTIRPLKFAGLKRMTDIKNYSDSRRKTKKHTKIQYILFGLKRYPHLQVSARDSIN